MSDSCSVIAVIPARFESSRFPGKILAAETGKPLIQHVYEQACRAELVGRVIVATDDPRIRDAVVGFGGECAMTRADHANGTSRIAEVAEGLEAEIIVNVQGDEPELPPSVIDLAVEKLLACKDCSMGTVASEFGGDDDPANPNIVKVFVDGEGWAIDFSRNVAPGKRHRGIEASRHQGQSREETVEPTMLKHIGLYVYRREFLATYVGLSPTPGEQEERLEQLRALEHGYSICVAIGEAPHPGIDTPEQYAAFVERWKKRNDLQY